MSAARRLLRCLLPMALLSTAHLLPADSTGASTNATSSCSVNIDEFVNYLHDLSKTEHRHSSGGRPSLPLCEMKFPEVNGRREARCAGAEAAGSCQDCVALLVEGRAVACLRRPRRRGTHQQPKLAQ